MTAPYSMQPQPYRSGMKKLSDPMANTGAPGGPQMGGGLNMGGGWADSPVPKFDPSGFKPNFGSSATPGVAQVNMQGQASQGGFPVMTGGTGAYERGAQARVPRGAHAVDEEPRPVNPRAGKG